MVLECVLLMHTGVWWGGVVMVVILMVGGHGLGLIVQDDCFGCFCMWGVCL